MNYKSKRFLGEKSLQIENIENKENKDTFDNNNDNIFKEIINLKQREIESLKSIIISLQNQIQELKKETKSNVLKEENSKILQGQIKKLKIPTEDLICSEEDISISNPKPIKKIIWPIFENELSSEINSIQSETKKINVLFKKESVFEDKQDFELKACSKKITTLINLDEKIELQQLNISVDCSKGNFIFH